MNTEAGTTIRRRRGIRRWVHRSGKRMLRALGEFQGRHSVLEVRPTFPEVDAFAFTAPLVAHWREVRDELDAVLEERERIPAFHRLSPDQYRISSGDDWKTYPFYVFGHRVDPNCEACPRTARVLDALDGLQNAWFSILAPGTRIPPHRGPSRALLRVHLGLKVPHERSRCWIRVGPEVLSWEEGQVLVFDDTFEHEVHNDTDEERVVLFLDFDRPMDRLGRFVNAALLGVLRRSHYVRVPLRNLEAWRRQSRG